ncbi:hypothetical protein L873DRAFT_1808729 [Choiromyces venosus 120613-1]|uniref:Uncharacterized protein n=1 Tax=Choiromyces venosus 120613-1 TaxID=1336337 RepID=A0A3N4JWQ4_9PEZI|nr:hypothetical protein L873DRAFT_1808729 [Choiromyces venosus 120613-1]
MIPLFRCTRFCRWVSSFSVSPYVKKAFGITLPAPVSPTITTTRDFSPIPVAETLGPRPVFIHNHYTNARSIRILSNNFPYGLDTIPMDHNSITRAEEEAVGPRRPNPALTWPIQ